MAGEYTNNTGQRFQTIGDVLQGAGSFQDGLERMTGALQAFDHSLTQVAQFMDDAMTVANNAESRAPSAGSFGESSRGADSEGDAGELGVIRVDELNQAIEQFISTLGRIEQIMEKATDIRVTVEAGDGWD